MRKKLNIILAILCAVIALYSGVTLASRLKDRLLSEKAEEDFTQAAGIDKNALQLPEQPVENPKQTDPEPALQAGPEAKEPVSRLLADEAAIELAGADIEALKALNSDSLGFFAIEGTNIAYPLVQGSDNEYYLYHTPDKKKNTAGSIFMETVCSSDFSDYNTIIYGHNLKNDTMFSGLHKYKDRAFFDEHRYVYITDEKVLRCYKIFSCHEAPIDSPVYYVSYTGNEKLEKVVLDYAVSSSIHQTGEEVPERARLLTLSTCTGNGHATRFVVQAYLEEEVPIEEFKKAEE